MQKFLIPAIGCVLIAAVVLAGVLAYPNYSQALSEKIQQNKYNRLYGVPVVGGNYSFMPPFSKYHAINLALASDNWTASDLQNMTVQISLVRVISFSNVTAAEQGKFTADHNITLSGYANPELNTTFSGSGPVGSEITVPASNYQAIVDGGISLRYVWSIIVVKDGSVTFPMGSYYLVDAATGEVFPHGILT